MQVSKILATIFVFALIACCFFTWISIDDPPIVVSGFHSAGTSFGKPGILHIIICALFLIFIFIPRIWSSRVAFFLSTFNIAWAVRNFIVISTCHSGVCPDKHIALYLVLAFSFLISLSSLFVTYPNKEKN